MLMPTVTRQKTETPRQRSPKIRSRYCRKSGWRRKPTWPTSLRRARDVKSFWMIWNFMCFLPVSLFFWMLSIEKRPELSAQGERKSVVPPEFGKFPLSCGAHAPRPGNGGPPPRLTPLQPRCSGTTSPAASQALPPSAPSLGSALRVLLPILAVLYVTIVYSPPGQMSRKTLSQAAGVPGGGAGGCAFRAARCRTGRCPGGPPPPSGSAPGGRPGRSAA